MSEQMKQGLDDQAEQVEAVNTEEQTGDQGEHEQQKQAQNKKYTDADVDRIVAKKIAAERSKLQKLFTGEQQESELEIRERKVLERELRADAKDALIAQGVPYTLANLLDYSSKENMERGMTEVVKIFNEAVQAGIDNRLRGRTPRTGSPAYKGDIGAAFAPKQY